MKKILSLLLVFMTSMISAHAQFERGVKYVGASALDWDFHTVRTRNSASDLTHMRAILWPTASC